MIYSLYHALIQPPTCPAHHWTRCLLASDHLHPLATVRKLEWVDLGGSDQNICYKFQVYHIISINFVLRRYGFLGWFEKLACTKPIRAHHQSKNLSMLWFRIGSFGQCKTFAEPLDSLNFCEASHTKMQHGQQNLLARNHAKSDG